MYCHSRLGRSHAINDQTEIPESSVYPPQRYRLCDHSHLCAAPFQFAALDHIHSPWFSAVEFVDLGLEGWHVPIGTGERVSAFK